MNASQLLQPLSAVAAPVFSAGDGCSRQRRHRRTESLPCKFSYQPAIRRSVECPTVRILYPVSPVQPRNPVRPSLTGSAVSVLNLYLLISFDFGVERPGYECISADRVTRRRPEHGIGRSVPVRRGGSSRRPPARTLGRPNFSRSLALLEQLVASVGGPRKLLQLWRAECVKLTNQRRSSTRLARMYEMLVVLAGQVRTRTDGYGTTEQMVSATGTTARGRNGVVLQ